MHFPCKKIFIGGYTKSGTTFLGRCFDILNGVEARGEMDYLRIFFGSFNKIAGSYGNNIQIVNREVYDGQGDLRPFDAGSLRVMHQKMFFHIFFNGQPLPQDCIAVVEKSPRNIFHYDAFRFCFPKGEFVTIYRQPDKVFRSLMRHMKDHRDDRYGDPTFAGRKKMLDGFCGRWNEMIEIIGKNRDGMHVVHYDHLSADAAGFLDYAQEKIIGQKTGLSAPVESLSKEAYLQSLPAEAREKSLVQTGTYKITLSDREQSIFRDRCNTYKGPFDY